MVDYKNTSIPSYFQGPFVDQRDAHGLMNWTADQELAVRQYIQQNIWAKTTEDILHKKKEIQAMDKERQNPVHKLGQITARKDSSKHLTIHFVPHTHDDVGWLKTYEEYFIGAKGKNDHSMVTQILSEVVMELLRDPNMRFTYVEMKYFNMWYTRQTKKMQDDVKMLINEGRLEITMGGWVGPEEVTAYYEDIIGNFVKGHKWLKDEFGV